MSVRFGCDDKVLIHFTKCIVQSDYRTIVLAFQKGGIMCQLALATSLEAQHARCHCTARLLLLYTTVQYQHRL